MMEFTTIAQFGGAVAALVPLVLITGFVVVIWRTVSLHTLLRRLWLLVHGSEEISDPTIRAYLDEQTNLMSFRMFSGVRAASLEEAHQLIQWAQINRIELHQIAACGRYFDIGLRQVRQHLFPSRPCLIAQIGVFAALLIASAWLMTVSQVPFTFKVSGRTFLAEGSSAQPLWPRLEPLRKSDCDQSLNANSTRTSFTEDEVKIVCSLLLAKEWPEHLATKLKEQRWFWLICTLLCLALLAREAVVVKKVLAAKDLLARGLIPALPGNQSVLDFYGKRD